jgi:hypothetical protein
VESDTAKGGFAMAAADVPPIAVVDLVRLLFRVERQTTTLGRSLQALSDVGDTIQVDFPFNDEEARGDFAQFLMSEMHAAYETIVLLALEIDRLKDSKS